MLIPRLSSYTLKPIFQCPSILTGSYNYRFFGLRPVTPPSRLIPPELDLVYPRPAAIFAFLRKTFSGSCRVFSASKRA